MEKYFDDWIIEEELGQGSFGKVYKISKEEFGTKYYSAMKVIRIPQDRSEKVRLASEGMDDNSITAYYMQFAQDFIKEIEVMASLQGNTNIVGYNDHRVVENEDGVGYTIYIRMEYLTPLDMYILANQGKKMSDAQILKLGIDICSALEVCSKKHIIHRDIKPDNIFVSENGDFKLGDFGIARKLEQTQSNLSKKGTYTYMAPEIYNGKAYNSTVDIYSLGIVLYRLFNNNRTPFLPFAPAPIRYTDKEKALISRVQGVPVPEIPSVNREINDIILKCCAFNPKERYQSAGELKAALIAVSEEPTWQAPFEDRSAGENSSAKDKTATDFDDATVGPSFASASPTFTETSDQENYSDKNDIPETKSSNPVQSQTYEEDESDKTVGPEFLPPVAYEKPNAEQDKNPVLNERIKNQSAGRQLDGNDADNKTVGVSFAVPESAPSDNGKTGENNSSVSGNKANVYAPYEPDDSKTDNKKKKVIIIAVCGAVLLIVLIAIVASIISSNSSGGSYNPSYYSYDTDSYDSDTDNNSNSENSYYSSTDETTTEEQTETTTEESTTEEPTQPETTTKKSSSSGSSGSSGRSNSGSSGSSSDGYDYHW